MKKMMKWIICLALAITMLAATAVGAMAAEITWEGNSDQISVYVKAGLRDIIGSFVESGATKSLVAPTSKYNNNSVIVLPGKIDLSMISNPTSALANNLYIDTVELQTNNGSFAPIGTPAKGIIPFSLNPDSQNTTYHLKITAKPIFNFGVISHNKDIVTAKDRSARIIAAADDNTVTLLNGSIEIEDIQYAAKINGNDIEWKPLDFDPTEAEEEAGYHAYGYSTRSSNGNVVEKIRIKYDTNNNKIPDKTYVECDIQLKDTRMPTTVLLFQNKSFAYSPDLSADTIADQIFDHVKAQNGTILIEETPHADVLFDSISTNVGSHTVTVRYKGNKEQYQGSSATATYTIKKGNAAITVNSQTKRYGEALSTPLFATFYKAENKNNPTAIDIFEFAVGATMNGDPVINLKVPFGKTILSPNELKLGNLTKLLELFDWAGESIDSNALDSVSKLITQLSDAIGINLNNVTINIKYTGDSVLPSKPDAGMYLIGAVTADLNYNTAANVGYVVVTPDGTKVELGFNVHDANGLITKEKIDDGSYDLGSKVLTEGQEAAAQRLRNLFIGVTEEGKLFVKDYKNGEKPALPFGLYSQISYVKDWNNEMYYAVPIARSFAVVPRTVVVDVPNQQTFNYEKGVQRRAAVSVKLNGNELSDSLKNKNLTVVYTGVSADVSSYGPTTTPPSERGIYSVLATYVEYESGSRVPKYFGMDAGTMTIGKGQTTFDVNNAEVFYQKGVQHFPEVTNPENLPAIYVIRDQKGNVNILMPQGWNIGSGTYDVNNAVTALLTALDTLPAHVKNQDAIDTLKDVLGKISIKKLSINDKKPEEIGIYSIIGIAYGSNYGALVDEGILTIKEPILPGGGTNDDVYDALDSLPQTGDNSELFVWVGMLFAAAAALMMLKRSKKVSE